MDLNKFEGKSLEKLIETVSAGIGVKYGHKIGKKNLNLLEDRKDEIEKVKLDGIINQESLNIEIIDKIKHRIIHQEVNRQVNLDNIIEKSAEYLNENVSDEPVDEDWRAKYFSKAQDITSNEMQDIWAKILANEVSSPGAVSLRTLEIVSNLSKKEAEIFERIACLALDKGNILKFDNENSFDEFGISYNDLLILRAANLVFDSDTLNLTFTYIKEINGTVIQFGTKIVKVQKENVTKFSFNQVSLTPSGTELMKTLNIKPNYAFFDKFIEEKTKQGYTFSNLEIIDLFAIANTLKTK